MLLDTNKIHYFLRGISLFVLICFTTTTVAQAQPSEPSVPGLQTIDHRPETNIPDLAEQITIPAEIGSIREVYSSKSQNQKGASLQSLASGLVIHIEEAHGQTEGQENIEKILIHLKTQYDLKTVFLEGTWGKLAPENLRILKDAKLNRELLEDLNQNGLIGGAELFLAEQTADDRPQTTDQDAKTGNLKVSAAVPSLQSAVSGYGVENVKLYRRNLEQFRKVYSAKPQTDAFLKDLRQKIAEDSARVFNSELKNFFKDWAFRTEVAGQPFAGLDSLRDNANKYLNLDLSDAREQYDWPQIVRFFKLKELEKSELNDQRATLNEKEKFFNWLDLSRLPPELITDGKNILKELCALPVARCAGQDTRSFWEHFYETASPKGFRFEDYPSLTRQIGIAILSSELQAPDLFREVEKLNDLTLDKLAARPEEKKLIKQYKEYCLLKKLFSLELSRGEFENLSARLQTTDQRPQEKSKAALTLSLSPREKKGEGDLLQAEVSSLMSAALDFYTTAQKREQAIFKNMLNRMKEIREPNAVLITGGFHSEGLSEFFKKNGIAYVRVSPRITKPQPPSSYLSLMTLQPELKSDFKVRLLLGDARPPSLIVGCSELRQALGAPTADRYRAELQNSIEKIGNRMQVPVDELIAPRLSAKTAPSLAQPMSHLAGVSTVGNSKSRSEARPAQIPGEADGLSLPAGRQTLDLRVAEARNNEKPAVLQAPALQSFYLKMKALDQKDVNGFLVELSPEATTREILVNSESNPSHPHRLSFARKALVTYSTKADPGFSKQYEGPVLLAEGSVYQGRLCVMKTVPVEKVLALFKNRYGFTEIFLIVCNSQNGKIENVDGLKIFHSTKSSIVDAAKSKNEIVVRTDGEWVTTETRADSSAKKDESVPLSRAEAREPTPHLVGGMLAEVPRRAETREESAAKNEPLTDKQIFEILADERYRSSFQKWMAAISLSGRLQAGARSKSGEIRLEEDQLREARLFRKATQMARLSKGKFRKMWLKTIGGMLRDERPFIKMAGFSEILGGKWSTAEWLSITDWIISSIRDMAREKELRRAGKEMEGEVKRTFPKDISRYLENYGIHAALDILQSGTDAMARESRVFWLGIHLSVATQLHLAKVYVFLGKHYRFFDHGEMLPHLPHFLVEPHLLLVLTLLGLFARTRGENKKVFAEKRQDLTPPAKIGPGAAEVSSEERAQKALESLRWRTFLEPLRKVDFEKDVHFHTEFYAKIARPFYDKLYDPVTREGLLKEILRKKIRLKDKKLRIWSAGCSYGLEALTLIWLTDMALSSLGQNPEDWKIDIAGTDEVVDVLRKAARLVRDGRASYSDRGKTVNVAVRTAPYLTEFFKVNHFNPQDRKDWAAVQKFEGDFDIIFMRGVPTGKYTAEESAGDWALGFLAEGGLFVDSGGFVATRSETRQEALEFRKVSEMDEEEIFTRGIGKVVATAQGEKGFWKRWTPEWWQGRGHDALAVFKEGTAMGVWAAGEISAGFIQDNGLFVLPEFRANGVGKTLRRALVFFLKKSGHEWFRIGAPEPYNRIPPDPRLQRFHEEMAGWPGVTAKRDQQHYLRFLLVHLPGTPENIAADFIRSDKETKTGDSHLFGDTRRSEMRAEVVEPELVSDPEVRKEEPSFDGGFRMTKVRPVDELVELVKTHDDDMFFEIPPDRTYESLSTDEDFFNMSWRISRRFRQPAYGWEKFSGDIRKLENILSVKGLYLGGGLKVFDIQEKEGQEWAYGVILSMRGGLSGLFKLWHTLLDVSTIRGIRNSEETACFFTSGLRGALFHGAAGVSNGVARLWYRILEWWEGWDAPIKKILTRFGTGRKIRRVMKTDAPMVQAYRRMQEVTVESVFLAKTRGFLDVALKWLILEWASLFALAPAKKIAGGYLKDFRWNSLKKTAVQGPEEHFRMQLLHENILRSHPSSVVQAYEDYAVTGNSIKISQNSETGLMNMLPYYAARANAGTPARPNQGRALTAMNGGKAADYSVPLEALAEQWKREQLDLLFKNAMEDAVSMAPEFLAARLVEIDTLLKDQRAEIFFQEPGVRAKLQEYADIIREALRREAKDIERWKKSKARSETRGSTKLTTPNDMRRGSSSFVTVPILINFRESEIGAVPTTMNQEKMKVGTENDGKASTVPSAEASAGRRAEARTDTPEEEAYRAFVDTAKRLAADAVDYTHNGTDLATDAVARIALARLDEFYKEDPGVIQVPREEFMSFLGARQLEFEANKDRLFKPFNALTAAEKAALVRWHEIRRSEARTANDQKPLAVTIAEKGMAPVTIREDGGYVLDDLVKEKSGTILYHGAAAKEFLKRTRVFENETQVIVPLDAEARVTTEGGTCTLSEPGAIGLSHGAQASVEITKGDVTVITVRTAPSWYWRPGDWHNRINVTGKIWERGGVVVYKHKDRKDGFELARGVEKETAWVTDSTTGPFPQSLFSPIIGVSRLEYLEPQAIHPFKTLRPEEKMHQHPVRDGNKELVETYIVTRGRAALLYFVKNPEGRYRPKILYMRSGDIVSVQSGVIHDIIAAETPFEYLVVFTPSVHQYGLWFKENVSDESVGMTPGLRAALVRKAMDHMHLDSSLPVTMGGSLPQSARRQTTGQAGTRSPADQPAVTPALNESVRLGQKSEVSSPSEVDGRAEMRADPGNSQAAASRIVAPLPSPSKASSSETGEGNFGKESRKGVVEKTDKKVLFVYAIFAAISFVIAGSFRANPFIFFAWAFFIWFFYDIVQHLSFFPEYAEYWAEAKRALIRKVEAKVFERNILTGKRATEAVEQILYKNTDFSQKKKIPDFIKDPELIRQMMQKPSGLRVRRLASRNGLNLTQEQASNVSGLLEEFREALDTVNPVYVLSETDKHLLRILRKITKATTFSFFGRLFFPIRPFSFTDPEPRTLLGKFLKEIKVENQSLKEARNVFELRRMIGELHEQAVKEGTPSVLYITGDSKVGKTTFLRMMREGLNSVYPDVEYLSMDDVYAKYDGQFESDGDLFNHLLRKAKNEKKRLVIVDGVGSHLLYEGQEGRHFFVRLRADRGTRLENIFREEVSTSLFWSRIKNVKGAFVIDLSRSRRPHREQIREIFSLKDPDVEKFKKDSLRYSAKQLNSNNRKKPKTAQDRKKDEHRSEVRAISSGLLEEIRARVGYPRVTARRLLSADYVFHDLMVQQVVNSGFRPLRVLYGGAAVDLSNLLLSTASAESVFVSFYKGLSFADVRAMEDPIARREWIDKWLGDYADKFGWGYAVNGTHRILFQKVAAMAFELKGIEAQDIRAEMDGNYPRLRFLWRHPLAKELLPHAVTFVDGDITKPDSYREILARGFDIYYQRAGEKIPLAYGKDTNFIETIAGHFSGDGYFITDDVAFDNTFYDPLGESKFIDRGFAFPLSLEIVPLPFYEELKRHILFMRSLDGKLDTPGTHYGWDVRIRRNTRFDPPAKQDGSSPKSTDESVQRMVADAPGGARAEMRDGGARTWVIHDLVTDAEKGLVYQAPILPENIKDLDTAWRDFNEMVFEFPKLLERASHEKLPVVLVVPEKMDGFGPLADESPWIEGARTALAWASAYFRFKELGNVDVRVLQLPEEKVTQDQISNAVKALLAKKIPDDAKTPEDRMAARMFPLKKILEEKTGPEANLLLEPVTIDALLREGKADEAILNSTMIHPKLPPVPAGKKRIVITGAAGFIGINLVKRLLAEGHQVVALDNLISANAAFAPLFEKEPNLYFKQFDVSGPFDVEGPVDQVLHLASLASPPDYYGRPLETLRTGLQATRETMELARRKKARYLFTSTSEVYGDPKVHPQPETYAGYVSPFKKRSQYDQSKRGAETLMKLYFQKYASEGLDLRIVRIFNTYGPYMRIDDGRVVTNFIGKIFSGEPIELYGDEKITRSFGYVDDTIEGFLKLLRTDKLTPATPIEERVFNIGNDGEFTLRELADLTNELGQKYLHKKVPVRIVEMKDPSDPRKRQPDLTRSRAFLGYEPTVSLRVGLEKTFLYFLELEYPNIYNYNPRLNNLVLRFAGSLLNRTFTLFLLPLAVVLSVIPFIAAWLGSRAYREDSGIFFRQKRVGYQGKEFTIYKFRTLFHKKGLTYNPYPWVRFLGLDELPQLWNVLKGDMVLWGGRPLVRSDLETKPALKSKYIDYMDHRKPGMMSLESLRRRLGKVFYDAKKRNDHKTKNFSRSEMRGATDQLDLEMRKAPEALKRLGQSLFVRRMAFKAPKQTMTGIYGNRLALSDILPAINSHNMLKEIERRFSIYTLMPDQETSGLALAEYLPVYVDYQSDPANIAMNGNLGSGRAFYIGSRFNVKGIKTPLVGRTADKGHSDGFLDLSTAVWEAIVANSLEQDLRTGTSPVVGIIDTHRFFDDPWWPNAKERAALIIRQDKGALDRPTHLFQKRKPLGKDELLHLADRFGREEAEKFIERIFHSAWSAGNISIEGHMLDYDTVRSVRCRPPQLVGKTFYTANLFGLEQNGQLMILESFEKTGLNQDKIPAEALKAAMEAAYADQLKQRFFDVMGLSTPSKDVDIRTFEKELEGLVSEFQALSRMMFPRYNAWDIYSPENNELAVFDFSNFFRYYPILRNSPQWSVEKAFLLLLNPDGKTKRRENKTIPDFMKRYVEDGGHVVRDQAMLEDCYRRALLFILSYDSLFTKLRKAAKSPEDRTAEMKAYVVNQDRPYLSPRFGRAVKENLVAMYKNGKLTPERFSLLIDKIIQANKRIPFRIHKDHYLSDMEVHANGYTGKLLSPKGDFRFLMAFFEPAAIPESKGTWVIKVNGEKYTCVLEKHDGEIWVMSPVFDNQKLMEELSFEFSFQDRKIMLEAIGKAPEMSARPAFKPDTAPSFKALALLDRMRQVALERELPDSRTAIPALESSRFDISQQTWDRFIGLVWRDVFVRTQLPKNGVIVEVASGSAPKVAWGLKEYGFHGTVYVLEPADTIQEAVIQYQKIIPGIKVVPIKKTLREGMNSLPRAPHLVLANHALDDMFLGEIVPSENFGPIFNNHYQLPASVTAREWRRSTRRLSYFKLLQAEGRIFRDWIRLMAEVTPQWLILNHYQSFVFRKEGLRAPDEKAFTLLERLSEMFLGLGCDVEFLRHHFIETPSLWVAIRPEEELRLKAGWSSPRQDSSRSEMRGEIPGEAVVAEHPVFGKVVDLRKLSLSIEQKKSFAAEIAALEKEAFEGQSAFGDTERNWSERLLGSDQMLVLINGQEKIDGVVWAVTPWSKEASKLQRILSRANGVKGKGTFLMDVYLSTLHHKGIPGAFWGSFWEKSTDFYEGYLKKKQQEGVLNYLGFRNEFSVTLKADPLAKRSEARPDTPESQASESLTAEINEWDEMIRDWKEALREKPVQIASGVQLAMKPETALEVLFDKPLAFHQNGRVVLFRHENKEAELTFISDRRLLEPMYDLSTLEMAGVFFLSHDNDEKMYIVQLTEDQKSLRFRRFPDALSVDAAKLPAVSAQTRQRKIGNIYTIRLSDLIQALGHDADQLAFVAQGAAQQTIDQPKNRSEARDVSKQVRLENSFTVRDLEANDLSSLVMNTKEIKQEEGPINVKPGQGYRAHLGTCAAYIVFDRSGTPVRFQHVFTSKFDAQLFQKEYSDLLNVDHRFLIIEGPGETADLKATFLSDLIQYLLHTAKLPSENVVLHKSDKYERFFNANDALNVVFAILKPAGTVVVSFLSNNSQLRRQRFGAEEISPAWAKKPDTPMEETRERIIPVKHPLAISNHSFLQRTIVSNTQPGRAEQRVAVDTAEGVFRISTVKAMGRDGLRNLLSQLMPNAYASQTTDQSLQTTVKDVLSKVQNASFQVSLTLNGTPSLNDPTVQLLTEILVKKPAMLVQIVAPDAASPELADLRQGLMKKALAGRRERGSDAKGVNLVVTAETAEIPGFLKANQERALVYDMRENGRAELEKLAPKVTKSEALLVFNDALFGQKTYALLAALDRLFDQNKLPQGVQSAASLLAANLQIAFVAKRELDTAA